MKKIKKLLGILLLGMTVLWGQMENTADIRAGGFERQEMELPPGDGRESSMSEEEPKLLPPAADDQGSSSQEEEMGEVRIERKNLKQEIKPGEDFSFTLTFTNTYRNTSLERMKLSFELPEGIHYTKDWKTDTIDVKEIKALGEGRKKITLTADQELKGPVAEIKAKLAYEYTSKGEREKGKSEETIILPVAQTKVQQEGENTGGDYQKDNWDGYGGDVMTYQGGTEGDQKKTPDPMTPNIMVKRYTYGENLKAGEEFTLEMEFINTSKKLALENAVISLVPGEALHIADQFSSFYIEKMNPGESVTEKIKMKVLPEGKPEGAEIALEAKYEFVKGTERTQASATDKLGITFVQTDRFGIGEIQCEKEIHSNEETTFTIPYVNKGKSMIYNLEARLETKGDCQETYKYLGNVESGTNGTIDFFVTPLETGKDTIKVILTYEDAQANVKTEERKLDLQVRETILEDLEAEGFGQDAYEENLDMEGGDKSGLYKKIGIGAGLLLLSGTLGRAIYRKKKRTKEVEL